jgi:hypothetical protein
VRWYYLSYSGFGLSNRHAVVEELVDREVNVQSRLLHTFTSVRILHKHMADFDSLLRIFGLLEGAA